ncbi:hypothetical protein SGPA1_30685 [Streptomyces misionensis JCM 4497]
MLLEVLVEAADVSVAAGGTASSAAVQQLLGATFHVQSEHDSRHYDQRDTSTVTCEQSRSLYEGGLAVAGRQTSDDSAARLCECHSARSLPLPD